MPLPAVEVERREVFADGNDLHWGPPEAAQELPPEWVLRALLGADLADDNQVLRLLAEGGVISRPYFDPAIVPPSAFPRLRAADLAADPGTEWWVDRNDGTLEDARWWLRTAQAMVGVWLAASLRRPVADAWSAAGFAWWAHDPNVERADERVWQQFTLSLDEGLRPFRARAEHTLTYSDGTATIFGRPRVGLYSAACHQIFNLLVEQPVPMTCAKCGQPFVKQLGRSAHGQHRASGVIYCSASCARAEAQRKYRQKKRLKQGEKR